MIPSVVTVMFDTCAPIRYLCCGMLPEPPNNRPIVLEDDGGGDTDARHLELAQVYAELGIRTMFPDDIRRTNATFVRSLLG